MANGRMAAAVGAAALAALLAGGGPAAAGGTDMVFRTGALENVETGRTLVYGHTRVAPEEGRDGEPGLEDGRILLTLNETGERAGRAAVVVMERSEDRWRRLDPFPGGAEAGNPVLLAFLELATGAVSKATGGNPHYVRNRIRDAFRAGGETEAATVTAGGESMPVTRISYRPFEGDPNATALGAFEGLTLTFEVAEEAPGHFVRLLASTGGAEAVYREEIALRPGAPADLPD